jgi:hypothetical protein
MNQHRSHRPQSARWLAFVLLLTGTVALAQSTQEQVHRMAYGVMPTDLRLLTALHRWFGAQLSEHGADARAE